VGLLAGCGLFHFTFKERVLSYGFQRLSYMAFVYKLNGRKPSTLYGFMGRKPLETTGVIEP
jgi:hypothetical protein